MKTKAKKRKWLKRRWLVVALLCGGGFAYLQTSKTLRSPEAILVLGGEPKREQFAAQFAEQHPHLPIWVSGGSNPEYAEWVFAEAGIPRGRVHLDYDAVDTVTNFTTLVEKLQAEGLDSLYLITSDYHMRRAQVIGTIILGSRGIQFQTIAIPSGKPAEPLEKVVFDGLRAALWVTTGDAGLKLKQLGQKQTAQEGVLPLLVKKLGKNP